MRTRQTRKTLRTRHIRALSDFTVPRVPRSQLSALLPLSLSNWPRSKRLNAPSARWAGTVHSIRTFLTFALRVPTVASRPSSQPSAQSALTSHSLRWVTCLTACHAKQATTATRKVSETLSRRVTSTSAPMDTSVPKATTLSLFLASLAPTLMESRPRPNLSASSRSSLDQKPLLTISKIVASAHVVSHAQQVPASGTATRAHRVPSAQPALDSANCAPQAGTVRAKVTVRLSQRSALKAIIAPLALKYQTHVVQKRSVLASRLVQPLVERPLRIANLAPT